LPGTRAIRIQVYVSRSDFAETLGAMREWLDTRRCLPVKFETAADGDLIRVSIGFPAGAIAEDFRLEFDPVQKAA
jgi:hypothetical protein